MPKGLYFCNAWLRLPHFFSVFIAGGVGISNMIQRIANKEYMGFENLCTYSA